MSEVTLVMFETGEGYDRCDWVVKAFSSKEKAAVYVGVMNNNLKLDNAHMDLRIHLSYEKMCEIRDKYNHSIDYNGGRYFVGQTITAE